MGLPDFDSGWLLIISGDAVWLEHDLNTTEVLVYVIMRIGNNVNQWVDVYYWEGLNSTDVELGKVAGEPLMELRLMMWKIAEP